MRCRFGPGRVIRPIDIQKSSGKSDRVRIMRITSMYKKNNQPQIRIYGMQNMNVDVRLNYCACVLTNTSIYRCIGIGRFDRWIFFRGQPHGG